MKLFEVYGSVCLLLAAVHIRDISTLVEPMDQLPPDLQSYFDTCRSTGDLTQTPARYVFWSAVNQYATKFVRSKPHMTQQETSFFRNTMNDAMSELELGQGQHRYKRQAGTRIRKEIRAMTEGERRRYFRAVNALKRDTRLPPNIYDFIADMHTGENINRAHFGYAFPGWHRLYLWFFEHFLRLHDPTVTIPYWASVLDQYMQDPTQSVLFSPGFFGNGNGDIRTGPFRNWPRIQPNTTFTRNVQRTDLYTYEGIDNILRRRRNSEILVPTALPDSNFETQHSGAHVFVGGSMNSLNSAARDPIFFSHHSFVDQIWNRFRVNQLRSGINPEQDYLFNQNDPRFRRQHNPTADAGFLLVNWTQSLGYSNAFDRTVFYEVVPGCPNCANSPYLFCDTTLRPARCVSRTIAEMGGRADVLNIDGIPPGRARRQAHFTTAHQPNLNVCPRQSFINDVQINWLDRPIPSQVPPTAWAYIPVKVVSKRPTEFHEFDDYSLYNKGRGQTLGNKGELFKLPIQKRFECCDRNQGAVGKITIVSHGLNYEGYSEEYVIIDNRMGVAEGSGFIPVRMPTHSGPIEAVIAAFDSCGRVCKPYCKKGSSGTMVTDSNFSGGIRISYANPRQFANSYADAMLNIWDVPSQSSCPSRNYDNIPVSFFCEYTDSWIWNSGAMPMGGRTPSMGGQWQPPRTGSSIHAPLHKVQKKFVKKGNKKAMKKQMRKMNRGRRPQTGGKQPFRRTSELDHLLKILPGTGRYTGRTH